MMDKMGEACSTYGKKRVQGLMGKHERDHFEDLGLDRRAILKCLIKK